MKDYATENKTLKKFKKIHLADVPSFPSVLPQPITVAFCPS